MRIITTSTGRLGVSLGPEAWSRVPILFCEYSHAMGNSVGSLQAFMDLFETYPHLAGGFIWDFVDQTLLKRTPDGHEVWAYGGDFGDEPSDGAFCANGLLAADRTPHPHAFEVAKVYQNIAVEPVDLAAGVVRIRNRHLFVDLGALRLAWSLTRNGEPLEDGELPLPAVPPGGTAEMTIPLSVDELLSDPLAEYHLLLEFALTQASAWAEAGLRVAWEQFEIPAASPLRPVTVTAAQAGVQPPLEISEPLTISGPSFSVAFDQATGALASFRSRGRELLAGPLVPNFWRALIDNDRFIVEGSLSRLTWLLRFAQGLHRLPRWRTAAANRRLLDLSLVQDEPGVVNVRTRYKVWGAQAPLELGYTILGSGEVIVAFDFSPRYEMLRLGMQLQLPGEYDRVRWFGRGPHESMPDRKTGAPVGIYGGRVEEMIHDYVRPQENGNRTDVRWATLTDAEGRGLRVTALGGVLLQFSAWPYALADLEAAEHIHELPRRDTITLNIDHLQRGVGDLLTILRGLPDEVRLPGGRQYRYRFALSPVG
jgi:beta-galactosidase